jgi:hypothetical protein
MEMTMVDPSFRARLQISSASNVPTTPDQWQLLIRNVWDEYGKLTDGRYNGEVDIKSTLDALQLSLKTSQSGALHKFCLSTRNTQAR